MKKLSFIWEFDRLPPTVSDVRIIPDADTKTFKYIGEGFAVDRRRMYFMGEEIILDKDFLISPDARKKIHGGPRCGILV